jgi:spermidine synthase
VSAAGRNIYFALFAVSGFTGLIYESIWSHYLKLFLGHAAYAQALVLAIFMGGMAFGAWLAGLLLPRLRNLLAGYAAVELLIGVLGLAFDPLFREMLATSREQILPALDSALAINIYKWSLSAALLLPQSILLGMTFPLMSNGILRSFPWTPGGAIALLYFTNSIGAAIGVLASGFALINAVGLPGTLWTAALLNLLLGALVLVLARGIETTAPAQPRPMAVSSAWPLLLLAAAFITGAASFIYEIAWIRMLSLVLGASTHAFELMLSAFITGLALGGLCIHRRIDRLRDPVRAAAWVQMLMGLFALLTIPLYNYTFDLMGYFMEVLERDAAGYRLFNLASHGICLLVMLPATFLAGMTLPLFTFILLKRGYGERSVSHIYAANTLGAIAGVAFAIGVGLPWLGLEGLVAYGSGLDILLGIVLLAAGAGGARAVGFWAPALAACAAFVIITVASGIDPRRLASGVFRTGWPALPEDGRVIFHRDGRTASVNVVEWTDSWRVIMTNGKPDASINMGDLDDPAIDENTMILAAALPLAIKPGARTVANIGMGSGLTTHVLLGWPALEYVDTVEIEPAMVEGARLFLPRVARAYSDPRSRIHYEDAKSFFAARGQRYEVIISEPSNPWVSGVASLFSREFYRDIQRHLEPQGLFVQWLQLYEINEDLVVSVLKALDAEFSDFALYASNDTNLLIVASPSGSSIGWPRDGVFQVKELAASLAHIGIRDLADLQVRYLGDKRLYGPYLRRHPVQMNSDYYPILEQNAPRARYLDQDAYDFAALRMLPVPLLPVLSDPAAITYRPGGRDIGFSYSESAPLAWELLAAATLNLPLREEHALLEHKLQNLLRLSKSCEAGQWPESWVDDLYAVAIAALPYLPERELARLWEAITPRCEPPWPAEAHKWLDLLFALSRRDVPAMTGAAEFLLGSGEERNIEQRRFLFSAALLGHVVGGDAPAAIELWDKHTSALFESTDDIPIGLKLLEAQARVEDWGLSARVKTDSTYARACNACSRC